MNRLTGVKTTNPKIKDWSDPKSVLGGVFKITRGVSVYVSRSEIFTANAGVQPDGEIDLSGGRYLGMRWLGLEVGGDLRRIAAIGGVLFALVAVLPVKLGFGPADAFDNAFAHRVAQSVDGGVVQADDGKALLCFVMGVFHGVQ